MNIASSISAATLAIAASLIPAPQAKAAPATCVLQSQDQVLRTTCDRQVRTNANGHKVVDLTFTNNGKSVKISAIWWVSPQTGRLHEAELFSQGKRVAVPAFEVPEQNLWCAGENRTYVCMGV